MNNCYCCHCMQHREQKDFSIWEAQKTKKRRLCNSCQELITDKKRHADKLEEMRIRNEQQNSKLTPVQRNYGKSEDAKRKRETRRGIEDWKDLVAIKEFTGSTI